MAVLRRRLSFLTAVAVALALGVPGSALADGSNPPLSDVVHGGTEPRYGLVVFGPDVMMSTQGTSSSG